MLPKSQSTDLVDWSARRSRMKPVHQTIIDPEKGNCWAACIASILELPLSAVPNFYGDDQQTWWVETNLWLAQYGLGVVEMQLASVWWEAARGEWEEHFPLCHWIASGPSPRFKGKLHATVYYKDELVHDPHPSGEGLQGAPTRATFFVVLDPSVLPRLAGLRYHLNEEAVSTDNQVYEIFRSVNKSLKLNDFAYVDWTLQRINVALHPINILIAYLTITALARDELKNRAAFYTAVKARLVYERPDEVDALLEGLE